MHIFIVFVYAEYNKSYTTWCFKTSKEAGDFVKKLEMLDSRLRIEWNTVGNYHQNSLGDSSNTSLTNFKKSYGYD